ncbi:hypothetical protein Patl1_33523 [Pistacia atlantica]|uniref:Uncharacterized protein n=1 Tax=Pistacia atlantica TaxID=434234 RepID=A0ACC0ZPZ4_9ROSI|nr:hypothetical protein Patl1_33523 [Pistacia atlantica]
MLVKLNIQSSGGIGLFIVVVKKKISRVDLGQVMWHRIPSKGDVSPWAKLSGFKNSCLPLKFKTHWTKCCVLANTNYITFVFYSPQKVVVNSVENWSMTFTAFVVISFHTQMPPLPYKFDVLLWMF